MFLSFKRLFKVYLIIHYIKYYRINNKIYLQIYFIKFHITKYKRGNMIYVKIS